MNDYIQHLEEQNEQLKEKLSKASLWEPMWYKSSDFEWRLSNGCFVYARLHPKYGPDDVYAVTVLNRSHGNIKGLKEAKESAWRLLMESLMEYEEKRKKYVGLHPAT